jgi:hypothetical protein
MWHNRALRFNFYLRGFKHLFIMRKPNDDDDVATKNKRGKVSWAYYKR